MGQLRACNKRNISICSLVNNYTMRIYVYYQSINRSQQYHSSFSAYNTLDSYFFSVRDSLTRSIHFMKFQVKQSLQHSLIIVLLYFDQFKLKIDNNLFHCIVFCPFLFLISPNTFTRRQTFSSEIDNFHCTLRNYSTWSVKNTNQL